MIHFDADNGGIVEIKDIFVAAVIAKKEGQIALQAGTQALHGLAFGQGLGRQEFHHLSTQEHAKAGLGVGGGQMAHLVANPLPASGRVAEMDSDG